jgi:CheY-like chemotaxis protein
MVPIDDSTQIRAKDRQTGAMLDFRAHLMLPRVLLIDDDMISREVLATVLTMSGYTVNTAIDGAGALAMMEGGEIDPELILMDTQMPGLNGLELLAELRARSQAAVFAISGSSPGDELIAAVDGFLLKPFGSDALRKAFDEHGPLARLSSTDGVDVDLPVVNPDILARMREMMPATAVREIYAAVAADVSARIEKVEEALAMDDTAELRRLGHAMKGGCSMAGAAQAAHLGALLESGFLDPGSNQTDNSARLLHDLRVATRNLKRMLKTEFKV